MKAALIGRPEGRCYGALFKRGRAAPCGLAVAFNGGEPAGAPGVGCAVVLDNSTGP
jgi:hypothetical protein